MRAHIQSVAIWFLLVTGSFTVTQPGSLSIGAEPSKRQFVANAQYEPERLLERDVRRFIDTHPGASAQGITAYANSALQEHGYIYKFHSCDFIDSRKLESLNSGHDPAIHSVYSLPFDLARGGRRTFKIHVEDVGPCSNCFALIPALSFSAQSVLAVLDGKKYLLKRPVEFRLEEIELVDETMKRVIRKWEVPNETFPIGVSADGRILYLPVEFTESDSDSNGWLMGDKARRVIRLQCSRFRRQGFGLKSLRKHWSIRILKRHGISPQALTAMVCRSCSSALKVKLTSFAILASALMALANLIAEASPNANENV